MAFTFSWRHFFVNLCAVFGYLWSSLAWLWVTAVYAPLLIKADALQWMLPQPHTPSTTPSLDISLPPIWMMVLGAAVTLIMIILTLYVLVKVPVMAIRQTSKAIHTTTDQLVPIMTHHKKISQKRQRLLTARLLLYVKLLFACLPVGLTFLALLAPRPQLSFELILFITTLLSLMAILSFSVQQLCVRWFRLPPQQIL